MYLDYYGLKRHPFQLTPDVNFFYDSRVHKRAMATISYGLSKLEGFVIVTGDVGAGKTTLIDYLLKNGQLKNVVVARISTTQLEAENLLELIASELNLRKSGASKASYLRDLNSFFLRLGQAGKSVLLIVDEVQNLSAGALEELRMLSNFQNNEKPLVQQLLVGQPEFRSRLASPACEQIRQRVIASYHLAPLTAEDVPIYIAHRMQQAGVRDQSLFTYGACQRIFAETGGVPRKINRLCDRLLLYGFLEELTRITCSAVDDVTAEMRGENLMDAVAAPPEQPKPISLAAPQAPLPALADQQDILDLPLTGDSGLALLAEPMNRQGASNAPQVRQDLASQMSQHQALLQHMGRLRRKMDLHKSRLSRLKLMLGQQTKNRGV
ncbi:hypothetical protein JCM17846_25070 [Iodidimonas nitroreducens]|uniref:ORC1/DEAH AAA+ ATPase domain-containing protein n=1 Tax=Iodidimonas nitroreducens TaxID=1236968 RepID=A0A5A7NAZ8_9PROT|nr:XrtA/PEP-CTERM system-associated ATPase [Iodidimonas nitroreducens]GAK32228.1 general secretion pathway protein A [alpha proteobacterium Q-1]GER04825.1 hypothetical protein JCM17846_25070 [Iodidimonas nitroreducens]